MTSIKKKTFSAKTSGLSIGKRTVAMSMKVSRSDSFDLDEADGLFADSRLAVNIERSDTLGMDGEPLRSVADVKGFRAGEDEFSIRMTFGVNDTDLEHLRALVFEGVLVKAERLGEAQGFGKSTEAESDDESDPGEGEVPSVGDTASLPFDHGIQIPEFLANDRGFRQRKLSKLEGISETLANTLTANQVQTVGNVLSRTEPLENITGIGARSAEIVAEAIQQLANEMAMQAA